MLAPPLVESAKVNGELVGACRNATGLMAAKLLYR